MNPYSIPSLLCMLVMPSLGAFIYSRNTRSQTHRLFLLLTALISYWAFTEFNIRQAESYRTAFFWTRAGAFRIFLSPLLIHFILVYIGRWNNYNKCKAIVLTYFIPCVMVALDIFTGSSSGYPKKGIYGWTIGIHLFPQIIIIYLVWKTSALLFVAKETKTFLNNARKSERQSFRLFFYGIIVAVFLGIIFTVRRTDYPDIPMLISLLFSVYLSGIIWKYNLFISSSDIEGDIFQTVGDGLIITGARNQILRVNDSLLKLTDYREKELICKDITILLDGSLINATLHEKQKSVESFETRLLSKTGRSVPVVLTYNTIFNKGNMPIGSVISLKDLTFWHKSQEEFARAEKLESFQLIIRSIVHDFNNMLTSINANLFLTGRDYSLPQEVQKNIMDAEKAVGIAMNLSKRLSSYSKEETMEMSVCDLKEIINESADLVLKRSQNSFKLTADHEVWPVNADRYRLLQVFINLFINSEQAMTHPGGIEVRCTNHQDEQGREYVKTSLSDEGKGIPKEIADSIFEPFFTTKSKGSGLGLSIAKNIIESHKGLISVKSEENEGTTFTILLPKASYHN